MKMKKVRAKQYLIHAALLATLAATPAASSAAGPSSAASGKRPNPFLHERQLFPYAIHAAERR